MNKFSEILVAWYNDNKRDLPWRNTTNPYKIWLSEIILQQTRVAQGMPYYLSFVENFPTVQDLASSSEEQVLRLWQGLGYYSRGRNLHFSAKYIINELNEDFPSTYIELLKLKGVGKYTAAAIASFAYNEKVAPVDGNVIRVLSRVYGIEKDTSELSTLKEIDGLANQLLPLKNHSTHNQAMMEFGALQCVPKSPNCSICPFVNSCVAFAKNKVGELPLKTKKIKKRNRFFNYFVYRFDNKIAFQKRGEKDIWQGLFEFNLIETIELTDTLELLKRVSFSKFKFIKEITLKKHVLSHQNLFSKFIEIELFEEPKGWKMYTIAELHHLPKPILIDNFLQEHIF